MLLLKLYLVFIRVLILIWCMLVFKKYMSYKDNPFLYQNYWKFHKKNTIYRYMYVWPMTIVHIVYIYSRNTYIELKLLFNYLLYDYIFIFFYIHSRLSIVRLTNFALRSKTFFLEIVPWSLRKYHHYI